MNKNRHRVVFNRHRGQWMAVAESAPGLAKGSGRRSRPSRRATTGLRTAAATLALGLGTAHAQIVADPHAPGSQRATVLEAGNGVPLVNVQTPSAAGVSRNTYSRFDVQRPGVVLNNSRKGANTHLAGQVQGNPWLAKGTAGIIVNEVVSGDPSQLRGAIEVAGDRAEVVIANPAGIAVDGAGFINASRATLTTGTPTITAGRLEGFEVRKGTVHIGPGGLDASDTDYAAVLARAVEVNGEIHAKELAVIAGPNRVSADHQQVTPIEGEGEAPAFALDVSELGGMYAGKIRLIGTEAGVGVRNAGTVAASSGKLVLQADGRLVNTGRIVSHVDVEAVFGGDVDNPGQIYAKRRTTVRARGDIHNRGAIAAQERTELLADGPQSEIRSDTGSILAAGLTPEGTLLPAAEGSSGEMLERGADLVVGATRRIEAHGDTAAATAIEMRAPTIDVGGSNSSAPRILLDAMAGPQRPRPRRGGSAGDAPVGGINAGNARLRARRLMLTTDGDLVTDGGSLAADELDIDAGGLSNAGGEIVELGSDGLTLNLDHGLDNTGGRLQTAGALSIRAGRLDNADGRIHSGGDLRIDVTGRFDNGDGSVSGATTTRVEADAFANAGYVAGPVSTAGDLDNGGTIDGSVHAGANLDNAGLIRGDAGAGGRLGNRGRIDGQAGAGGLLDNAGHVAGNASAAGDLHNTGVVGGRASAGRNLDNQGWIDGDAIAGARLDNQGGIGGDARADDIANAGSIAGDAEADTRLTNRGTITGFARAERIDNAGLLAGGVHAGTALASSGVIASDATSGGSLANTGLIAGSALAMDIANDGTIGGFALAERDMTNNGVIYGDAIALRTLQNGSDGLIGGRTIGGRIANRGVLMTSAAALEALVNEGLIGGDAFSGSIDNTGVIGGNASTMDTPAGAAGAGRIINAGLIVGSTLGSDVANAGEIGGDVLAGRDLANDGVIGGDAVALGSLRNGDHGLIGGAAVGGRIENRGVLMTSAAALEALVNGGLIGGDAFGGSIGNTGIIGGNASTVGMPTGAAGAGRITNAGLIVGSALGSDVANAGEIGGGVLAGRDLANDGVIGGDAVALGSLRNGDHGLIGGAAVGGRIENRGLLMTSAAALEALTNEGLIFGSVSGDRVDNRGVIGGDARARTALGNDGTIFGHARARRIDNRGVLATSAEALEALANEGLIGGDVRAAEIDNGGDIGGSARADEDLVNRGAIAGDANAGATLSNQGRIAGSAHATHVHNRGIILGTAGAGADLANAGTIAGSARTGGTLTNEGLIGGDAQAGIIANGGEIDGRAQADSALHNNGLIAGDADGTDIANTGVIGGGANAAGHIDNQGAIGGAARAGDFIANSGTIGAWASAGSRLWNTGSIGGDASAADSVSNAGQIAGDAHARSLRNDGAIGGSASATRIANTGTIGGDASGTSIDNAGAIGGNASAGGRLVNRGDIYGSAAAADLDNRGWIQDRVSVGHHLANSGRIDGDASAASISNSGTIAANAEASDDLVNTGQIAGNVRASTLENDGFIDRDLVISGDVVNHGRIGGSIHATTVDNDGVIGSAGLEYSIHADTLTNSGSLEGGTALLRVDRFDNDGGQVRVGTLGLWANDVSNVGGRLEATELGVVSVRDTLDNRNGTIGSDGALAVLDGGDAAAGAGMHFMNAGGLVHGDGVLLEASHVGDGGLVRSEGTFTLYADGDLTLGEGSFLYESAEHARIDVDGRLTNDTTVHAEQSLSVSARSVENNGELSSDGLTVIRATDGEVVNHGVIGGARVSISGAGLVNEGEIRADSFEAMVRGDAANLGGRIDVLADADFDVSGDFTTAGGGIDAGQIRLTVGGNVHLERLSGAPRVVDTGTPGTGTTAADPQSHLAAHDGDIEIAVGGNLTLRGARLDAHGDLDLRVGGNLTAQRVLVSAEGHIEGFIGGQIDIGVALDSDSRYTVAESREQWFGDGDGTGYAGTTVRSSTRQSAQGSAIRAGGSIAMLSGGDARYIGTDFHSGGAIVLGSTAGSIDVSAAVLHDTERFAEDLHSERWGDSQRISSHDRETTHATTVTLDAGQGVDIRAGGDIRLIGVDAHAGAGSLLAVAGGDVSVAALQVGSRESRHWQTVHFDDNPDGAAPHAPEYVDHHSSQANLGMAGGTLTAGDGIVLAAGTDPFGEDTRTTLGALGLPDAAESGTPHGSGTLRVSGVAIDGGAGDVTLSARRFLDLGSEADQTHTDGSVTYGDTQGSIRGKDVHLQVSEGDALLTDLGIAADGELVLQAAGTARLASVDLAAQGALTVTAGQHLIIEGGLERAPSESAEDNLDTPATALTDAADGPHVNDRAARYRNTSDNPAEWARTGASRLQSGATLTLASAGPLASSGTDYAARDFVAVAGDDLTIAGSRITEHQASPDGREKHTRIGAVSAHIDADTVTVQGLGVRPQGAEALEGEDYDSDVRLTDVEITSRGSTRIEATGDVGIEPGQNYAHDYRHRSSSGVFTTRVRIDERTQLSAQPSRIEAGTLEIAAKGDVHITATQIQLGGESHIEAEGDVEYLAAETVAQDTHYDKRGLSLGPIRIKERSREVTIQSIDTLPTHIQAEGDVFSTSGGDTTMVGTRIEAGAHTVHVEVGGTLTLEAAYDLSQTRVVERSFSLGDGLAFASMALGTGPALGKTAIHTRDSTVDTESEAQTVLLHGDRVEIETQDLVLAGAEVMGDAGSEIRIGGSLTRRDVANTTNHVEEHRESHFGAFANTSDGRVHDIGMSPQRGKDARTDTQSGAVFNTLSGGEGTLHVVTQGDADLTGTDLAGGENLLIEAGGTARLDGADDMRRHDWSAQDRVTVGKGEDATRSSTISTRVQDARIRTDGTFVVRAAKVELGAIDVSAGGGTRLEADEAVVLLKTDTDFHQFEQKDNDWSYTITSDQGDYDESTHAARITGGLDTGDARLTAQVDVGAADGASLGQADLRSLYNATPQGLGQDWMGGLGANGNTKFEAVNTAHQRWDVDQQGLTQAGTVVVVAVVSYFTGGAASNAAGSAAVQAGVSQGAAATVGGMAGAGAASLASTTAISFANSGGDLGAAFDTLFDEDTWKGAAVATLGAGVGSTLGGNGLDRIMTRGVVNAGITKVVFGDDTDDFGSLVLYNVVSDYSALGANTIGATWGGGQNPALQTLAHAGLGCVSAAAVGGDCTAGAVGGVTESLIDNTVTALDIPIDAHNPLHRAIYTTGATLAGGAVASELGLDVEDAQHTAGNAAVNNRLATPKEKERIKQLAHGDDEKEARLMVASCALTHCSSEFEEGSETWQYMRSLEFAGSSPEFAAERALLQGQTSGRWTYGDPQTGYVKTEEPLFQYSKADAARDWFVRQDNTYAITTRSGGALQLVGGAAGVGAGVVLAAAGATACGVSGGLSCALVPAGFGVVGMSYDQGVAGAQTVIVGTPTPTWGGRFIADAFGVSLSTGELAYGFVDVLATGGLARAIAPRSVFADGYGSGMVRNAVDEEIVAGPGVGAQGASGSVASAGARNYGVAFFGDSNLGYYTRETATIGRDGKSFFFMPLEDSAVVKNAGDAARYTGRAPSADAAYLEGGDIFGLSFPTTGVNVSRPTAADAGGWPHYLEGGNTAIRLGNGPTAGYLINPTREFVFPGGNQVPSGSVLFKLGPDGEWIPMRNF